MYRRHDIARKKVKVMPKVTIIIPVYNVEKYLERCLDSILNQTFNDYEVICVNDCSPDNSAEILNEYAKKYEHIRILSNDKNLGLGRTREKGIKEARSEYIMLIDSDDYVSPDYIETYYNEMENDSNLDAVIGGYIRDVDGKKKKYIPIDSVWSSVTYTIACAKMYRKDFITENKLTFTDVRMGEDIFFSLSTFYCGMKYKIINYSGYYYYFNRKSITGSMNYSKNHEMFISDIFDRFMEKYDISLLDENRYRIIEYDYIANMVNALVVYGRGAGITRMREKREFVLLDLSRKFPDYKNNPYVGIFKPRGQTRKIRLGVGIIMKGSKFGLDRIVLALVSLF